MDIELNFTAKEPNRCEFQIKGSQDDLIKSFTAIYSVPQGKEFVGRILEAAQVAYFNNEQSN